MTKTETIKMITPMASAVFPHLTETESFMGQDSGKYAITLEFTPEDVAEMEEAISALNVKGGTSPLKKIPDDAEYGAGNYRLKAKSRYKVKVVNREKEVIDAGTISNGAQVRASIGFAPYQTGANSGVTVYLNGLQLLTATPSMGGLDFGDLPAGLPEDEPLPF